MSISVNGSQSMFKALFMFNFAKYIEWPNMEQQSEFVIGVLGNDEIIPELNKLAGARKINNKKIVVKSVKTPAEGNGVHIFYVPNTKSNQIQKVVANFKGSPTLIVTDKPSLCKVGSHINYVTVDGKMKFEVNKQNIINHNLNVDPKLVALGISVQ